MELLLLVSFFFFFFCEKIALHVGLLLLPAFSAFSVQAQKLNQQPVVMYDMGNRDFVIKRNKVNKSAAVDIFFVVLPFSFQKTYPPNVFPISYVKTLLCMV